MAFAVPHVHTAFSVDQAVTGEQSKVVCLRLGTDWDPNCMKMDEVLAGAMPSLETLCNIYAVDVREVPECVSEFQLSEPMTLIFFFRGKPLRVDLGAGATPKLTSVIENRQEFVSLVEAVHRGATQGRDVITAPRDYSMQFGY
mmetsp:Transcript_48845/g.109845  ORF Transcript_48845/g.109845 Transcript_48845/m.109845 type:complete len:143 (-) Transcript_48845:84-512(-)